MDVLCDADEEKEKLKESTEEEAQAESVSRAGAQAAFASRNTTPRRRIRHRAGADESSVLNDICFYGKDLVRGFQ